MADQLSLLDDLDLQVHRDDLVAHEDDLFAPDGRQRCPGCRRPLTAFGGRLYCINIGCSEVSR